jgi:hypothetical protein
MKSHSQRVKFWILLTSKESGGKRRNLMALLEVSIPSLSNVEICLTPSPQLLLQITCSFSENPLPCDHKPSLCVFHTFYNVVLSSFAGPSESVSSSATPTHALHLSTHSKPSDLPPRCNPSIDDSVHHNVTPSLSWCKYICDVSITFLFPCGRAQPVWSSGLL